MSPQAFDRFMVSVRNGTNFRLAKLNHATYRAFFSAVVPIAAMSDIRGAFMVDGQPATVEDMRIIAPTLTAAECRTALAALHQAGLLEHDRDIGADWVRDFDQWNPEPKKDTTNAQRQARYRERQKASRNAVTSIVTNGSVTPTEVEVEGEEEVTPPSPPQAGGACPSPLVGGRARHRERRDTEIGAFAAEHFPGVPFGLVKHCASLLRQAGREPTPDALRPLIENGGVIAA